MDGIRPDVEAPPGTYLSVRRLALVERREGGAVLPDGGRGWIRVPRAWLPVAVVACAIAGLAYLVALPAFGAWLVVRFAALEIVEAARAVAARLRPGQGASRSR